MPTPATDRDLAQAILRALAVATAFLSDDDDHRGTALAAAITELGTDAEDFLEFLVGLLVVIRKIFQHTDTAPGDVLPRIALGFAQVE